MKSIKLLLLLSAVWGQSYAQTAPADRRPLPGEGSARTELDLSRRQTFAAKQGVEVSVDGARLAPGQAAGTFTSQPIAVALAHPRPFLAVHVTWLGQNILAENLHPALRYSADGIAWSAWEPQRFDGHAGDDAARTTIQQYLDATTHFVQVRAELGATGPRTTLRSVAVNFYSPGETLAAPQPEPEHQERAVGPLTSLAAAVCPKPAVVSRASWGASAPRSINDPTPITHLVVHHEEGPNTAANGDWAARVRAVQNLHMTTNGWADIGYAFLVDPNGVIYEGRAGGEDTQGAHWCGGNRNAMGVCMLGSYVTASPTAAAKESLAKLLAWKASKNGIDPLGKSTHYQAGFVNNVCGHRDNNGCSDCPGGQLYSELGTIRARINTLVNSCSGTPPPPTTDTQAPTTSISAPGTTVAADFTATFADADNVGVTERYYQVLESADGAEWRANRGNGFFNDNFNAAPLSAEWTTPTGTWAVNADQRLQQTNAALTNTNAATALAQGSGQAYLYNFAAKLNSNAGARRFGLHIFASDVAGQERGNSYLVWVSADDQRVRLIETSAGNTLTERASAAWTTTAGNWADYKVTYNSATGALAVFVNEARALSWTAPAPLASGAGISLRTNGANVEFDNVKVYKSRAATRLVTVGPAASKDLRRNSANASTPAGKLKSLVRDAAGNWSAVGNLDLVVNLPAARALAADPAYSTYPAYPNPARNQLRFAAPAGASLATLRAEVRRVPDGALLPNVDYSPAGLLNVSALPQGVYLLTLFDGPRVVSRQRFEKE